MRAQPGWIGSVTAITHCCDSILQKVQHLPKETMKHNHLIDIDIKNTNDQNLLSRSVLGVFGLDVHVGRERNVESCAKCGTDGTVMDRTPSDERVAII